MASFTIVNGYRPGAIGRITEMHGQYYSRLWDFGLFFEAKVATELSAFLQRYNDKRDGIWLVIADNHIEGAIVIDGSHADGEGAHLRWFIISEKLKGCGAGNLLVENAISFCNDNQYNKTFLWTFEGLHAARHLYEKAGFTLMEEHLGSQWGIEVKEQYFERDLSTADRK